MNNAVIAGARHFIRCIAGIRTHEPVQCIVVMARLSLLIVLQASLLCTAQAFVQLPASACLVSQGSHAAGTQIHGRQRRAHSELAAEQPTSSCDRFTFLKDSAATAGSVLGIYIAAGTLAPECAAAKKGEEAEVEELPVDWNEEFGRVKATSADIMKEIRKLSSDEDWEPLKERTRFLDLDFRKAMMGKVRKKFPSEEKKLKEDAMALSNAVSFDFIAVNKAARVEDKTRALEVIDILEADVQSFLDLEKRLH